MIDKVQKIREEVEKLKLQLLRGACSSQIAMETMCKEEAYNEVLSIIESMQEKHVSIWHDAIKKSDNPENVVIINPSDNTGEVLTKCTGVNQGHIWAYTSELLNLDNSCNIGKNLQEPQVKESTKTQHVNDMCKEKGNSLTQESVSKDFETALAEMVAKAQTSVVEPLVVAAQWKDCLIELAKSEEPVSEELEEAATLYAKEEYSRKNPATLPDRCIGCYAPIMYAFKAGAKWQKKKDESTTENLGEYINELSKQFPEVSFAKLSRIAVRVAKWQKEQMMAKVIDATCFALQGAALFTFRLPAGSYLVGSKVKVIVIKED